MEFGHLGGVPQPYPWGTTAITMDPSPKPVRPGELLTRNELVTWHCEVEGGGMARHGMAWMDWVSLFAMGLVDPRRWTASENIVKTPEKMMLGRRSDFFLLPFFFHHENLYVWFLRWDLILRWQCWYYNDLDLPPFSSRDARTYCKTFSSWWGRLHPGAGGEWVK